MNNTLRDKITMREVIRNYSWQFFFSSFELADFPFEVLFLGIEKDKDFVISPWVEDGELSEIGEMQLVVGHELKDLLDKKIKIYGAELRVVQVLKDTDSYMDHAIYTDMSTIEKMISMMDDTNSKLFEGINPKDVISSVLIEVEDGYTVASVLDDINVRVRGVEAARSNSTITDTSQKLRGLASIARLMVVAIVLLIVTIVVMAHKIGINERKKEFAILRIIGATKKKIIGIIIGEAVGVTIIGSSLGAVLAVGIIKLSNEYIEHILNIPFKIPNMGIMVIVGISSILILALIVTITSIFDGNKICGNDSGILLRVE